MTLNKQTRPDHGEGPLAVRESDTKRLTQQADFECVTPDDGLQQTRHEPEPDFFIHVTEAKCIDGCLTL
ncbi:MAG: hypothetical protein ACPGZP_11705 [Panacagrimonas sp.]